MSGADTPATTLLVAAGIHTFDTAGGPARRALLLVGDRIAWLGPSARAAPPHERQIDLGGAWICPSFVDAHVHGTATGLALLGLDVSGAGSLAECLDRLRRHARERTDDVVIGFSWDDFAWPEQRPPTAADIADAAPDRAVLLVRVDGHSCVVDPGTLSRLPLDGLAGVDRDADGRPTGLLVEQAAEAARRRLFARLPETQLDAARRATCRRAAALGIGSLHEMGHPAISGLADARTWAAGDWPVEVHTWWAQLDPMIEDLRPGGDLFLDGSIGSHTAAVFDGYADGGGAGWLFHDDDTVAAFFTAATRAGRGAGVHAIGDRAVDQAVRALERTAGVAGRDAVRACRHRIEHAEMVSLDLVTRVADLGVVLSVQPAFDAAWGGPDGLYARRFGAAAACRTNPLAWFAASGVPMAFGSDATVTPLDPWGAVWAAEHHRGGHGLARAQALATHTLGGRFAAGQDAEVGPLRAGARADLAVWGGDPLTVEDPRALPCLATVVAGRAVHGAFGVAPSP